MVTIPRQAAALLAALLALGARAGAQCSDGSPPPCLVARKSIDPNRIAVVPFRVAGAPMLAYLRDGLVELVSAAFNGDAGPAAVEAGESLAAWKNLGAGLEPSTADAARRAGRALFAGQVLYGSIVGNPRRFTVTASILRTSGGVQVPPVQLEGSEDSLPALVSTLAIRLQGGTAGLAPGASSEAYREYFAGMEAYRRSRGDSASRHFARALELDATLVHAAYRMVLLRVLSGPTGPIDSTLLPNLWARRHRLSIEQRRLLEAVADSNRVVFRMPSLRRLEQVMPVLQDSPEAWDILGDLYFHVGAAAGYEDWAARSERAFRRANQLGSKLCGCTNEHLADFAFWRGDAREFARFSQGTPWQRYVAAILERNPATIRLARREYVRDELVPSGTFFLPPWLSGMTLPQTETDSILAEAQSLAATDIQKRRVAIWSIDASAKGGRLGRAAELRQAYGRDARPSPPPTLAYAEADSAETEELAQMLGNSLPLGGLEACEVALSRLRRGDTTGVAAIVAMQPRLDDGRTVVDGLATLRAGQIDKICGPVVRGVFDAMTTGSDAFLFRADSVMRFNPLNGGFHLNYDLGLAFARGGTYAAAASAARRRWVSVGASNPSRIVIALRQDGRWAALAGDTAAARKAYGEYLLWRETPDPALIPQRDSVRAELAALTRGRRR